MERELNGEINRELNGNASCLTEPTDAFYLVADLVVTLMSTVRSAFSGVFLLRAQSALKGRMCKSSKQAHYDVE